MATQTATLPSQPGERRATTKVPTETHSFEQVVGSHYLWSGTAMGSETVEDLIDVLDRARARAAEIVSLLPSGMVLTDVSSNAGPLSPLLTALPSKAVLVAGQIVPQGTLALEVIKGAPERSDALDPRGRQQGGATIIDLEQHRKMRQAERDDDTLSDRARAAIQLLDSWLADDTGYDEATWPEVKRGLEEHRLSSRRLFAG